VSRVVWHVTMSLDGFIAGPDDAWDWAFKVRDPEDPENGVAGQRRPVELERSELDEAGQLTSLRYRVKR
jgi:hypothetical protein